ncbi:acyl carrier protein [Micromonospora sp. NPDC005203]|uniref:acyl carrier protein n=1 Tax=Micromonospora sp. NPDC005203 TaxID=3364226 RepID=UPI0036C999E6
MSGPAADLGAALDALPADLFDCVQVNLALLADVRHGLGTHLRLGARLAFRPRLDDGWWTVEPVVADQVEHSAGLLGLGLDERWDACPAGRVPGLIARREPLYVVADAYHLPWLPYAGQEHLRHSFLVHSHDDGVRVWDAYRNDTRWGPAVPGHWDLSEKDLIAALGDTADVISFGTAALPEPRPAVEFDDPTEYLAAYADAPDPAAAFARLPLQTWLLARSRLLHAAYRDLELQEHLGAWQGLVQQTYVAWRMVQRGRPAPEAPLRRLGDLLHRDQVLFAVPTAGGQPWRQHVAEAAASVLGLPVPAVLGGARFDASPEYGSLRIVEIVELVERVVGVELSADDLVPENLQDLDGLCRIVARAGTGAP